MTTETGLFLACGIITALSVFFGCIGPPRKHGSDFCRMAELIYQHKKKRGIKQ